MIVLSMKQMMVVQIVVVFVCNCLFWFMCLCKYVFLMVGSFFFDFLLYEEGLMVYCCWVFFVFDFWLGVYVFVLGVGFDIVVFDEFFEVFQVFFYGV